MRKLVQSLFVSSVILFVFARCSHDSLDVNVSGINLNLELIRLDEAVFTTDWDSASESNLKLYNEFGDYYKLYSEFILNNKISVSSPTMGMRMAGFANDKTIRDFYYAEQKFFGGEKFQPYFRELENGFKHYNFYFPDEPIPVILTFQSGFNFKIVPNDTLLGIGLEWFIGSDNELIKLLSPQAFPNYVKDKMDAKYMVVDAIKGFLKVKYQEQLKMDNLLKVMVFYGKILYLTEAMLPDKEKSLLMDYTPNEEKWLVKNENLIWVFLAENNLLFSTSMSEIIKWVNDGPFTNGLPQESPSRAGIWIGWQMVSQYMEKHPETSLQKLIYNTDENVILRAYKPKK